MWKWFQMASSLTKAHIMGDVFIPWGKAVIPVILINKGFIALRAVPSARGDASLA